MKAATRSGLVAMAAIGGLALTISLGRWQLSRAAQKEAVALAMAAQAALPPLAGADLAASRRPDEVLHRRVQLRGRWLAQHSLYLDNRQMGARQGLYVVTPLALAEGEKVVLVQRGWVARNFLDRSRLPPIETPEGWVHVEGRMAPPPGKLYELGPAAEGQIRQNLDIAAFALETGLALMPVTVQQTGAASEGLLRDWPVVSSGVDKHHGYAFQWFGLSALIAVLYVWFQFVRPIRARR